VHSLAKALARELRGYNIRVNAIAPGLIETDIFQDKLTDEIRRDVLKSVPLARLGAPTSGCRRLLPGLVGRILHHRLDHRRQWRPAYPLERDDFRSAHIRRG
jgi:NAD(P)-dependent dehydrogenase (short-subunit alcohol dehydrogenase family)